MNEKHDLTLSSPLSGIVVAGLRGGSGKSVVAVGLTAALTGQGMRVAPFKKGPDYIDAGWLALAAGRPCYNLDPYLIPPEMLVASYYHRLQNANVVLVEGNRGLFDGVDVSGSFSTAELAVQLDLPVLLVVDCTKTTRTMAALVLGCQKLDPRVRIAGVVLNRVAGARHRSIVTKSIEQYTGVPVVGALPKLGTDIFPQRHLGVTPFQEHEGAHEAVTDLARLMAEHLDLDAVRRIMAPVAAPPVGMPSLFPPPVIGEKTRIGVVRDAAFQFYYPDNLEALIAAGAEVIEINALTATALPEIDGLYIGGGFPETSAGALADNISFRHSVREKALAGMPMYAECGGLIYLGESIQLDGVEYPLAGVLPVRFALAAKPQAHGYTVLRVVRENPYFRAGETIQGHEFRYSRVIDWPGKAEECAFRMERGVGFAEGSDGLIAANVLALYTHIHALGVPTWAPALVAAARNWRQDRM